MPHELISPFVNMWTDLLPSVLLFTVFITLPASVLIARWGKLPIWLPFVLILFLNLIGLGISLILAWVNRIRIEGLRVNVYEHSDKTHYPPFKQDNPKPHAQGGQVAQPDVAPMQTPPVAATRLCPFCAEEIKVAAIVCKHCGRDVGTNVQQPASVSTPLSTVQLSPPPNALQMPSSPAMNWKQSQPVQPHMKWRYDEPANAAASFSPVPVLGSALSDSATSSHADNQHESDWQVPTHSKALKIGLVVLGILFLAVVLFAAYTIYSAYMEDQRRIAPALTSTETRREKCKTRAMLAAKGVSL